MLTPAPPGEADASGAPLSGGEAPVSDARLSDGQVAEMLRASVGDPFLTSLLLEVQARRLADGRRQPPPRREAFGERTLRWVRESLTDDVRALYEDPYVFAYDPGDNAEVKILEEWEMLEEAARELRDDIQEIADRVASEWDRGRMEAILSAGRLARERALAPPPVGPAEPEEQEAL